MRTKLLMGLAIAGLGLIAGCYVNLGGSCSRPKESVSQEPGPSATAGPRDIAVEEIEAVRKLAVESDRHDLLRRIAERPHLSPPAQVHLVKVACESLAVEPDRADVLLTLARNPGLSEQGVRALVRFVDSLAVESDRREVLEEVGKHQSRPPFPGPVPGMVPPPVPGPETPPDR